MSAEIANRANIKPTQRHITAGMGQQKLVMPKVSDSIHRYSVGVLQLASPDTPVIAAKQMGVSQNSGTPSKHVGSFWLPFAAHPKVALF